MKSVKLSAFLKLKYDPDELNTLAELLVLCINRYDKRPPMMSHVTLNSFRVYLDPRNRFPIRSIHLRNHQHRTTTAQMTARNQNHLLSQTWNTIGIQYNARPTSAIQYFQTQVYNHLLPQQQNYIVQQGMFLQHIHLDEIIEHEDFFGVGVPYTSNTYDGMAYTSNGKNKTGPSTLVIC